MGDGEVRLPAWAGPSGDGISFDAATSVQERLGISNLTARSAIRTLERAGVLREFDPQRRRGRTYLAQEIYASIGEPSST